MSELDEKEPVGTQCPSCERYYNDCNRPEFIFCNVCEEYVCPDCVSKYCLGNDFKVCTLCASDEQELIKTLIDRLDEKISDVLLLKTKLGNIESVCV